MREGDKPPEAGVSSQYARSRFAELLRRVEHGKERIRLLRRGKAIAYIVPLEDVEEPFRTAVGSDTPPIPMPYAGENTLSDDMPLDNYPEPVVNAEPEDASYMADFPTEMPDMPSQIEPHHELMLEHNDDSQRHVAILGFKKGLNRIFTASEMLTRNEMAQRLRKDGYLSSSLRRMLGEG